MRFVWVFLSLLFATQFAIVGINAYYDDDGWLWRGYPQERWMAEQMHQGNNIAGRQNFRIRALVTETIRQAKQVPEVVVLGSSRAMIVGEHMLRHESVSNHSISSARIVHYLSVLGQYAERGMQPATVVIGVDPWIFKDEQIVIWPMEQGARILSGQLNQDPARIGLKESLPWSAYFSGQEAWGLLTRKPATDRCDSPTVLRDENTPCAMRRADGTLQYPADQIAATQEAVEQQVRWEARGRMHSFDGYRAVDPVRVQVFRDFLALMQQRGIDVALFLAPYHPLVEEHQTGRRDWALTQEAEAIVRKTAGELNIPIYGAYSAHVASCSAVEFYDGIHARESCLSRILAPLAEGLKARKAMVR